ncbi:MAG TPA: molybdopterin-guanine dinucleotide biosynthesis protein B [Bacillota bacterium]|nr:molybdopterin-guanine dinucleotide biosynthesis protein B [Bacillota bacterium]
MSITPVLQVVGYKNSGKTTTACRLIEYFAQRGLKVGSIKHDAHDFEVDYPGKDTWRHREAGASAVAISSKDKTAYMEQVGTSLEDLISRMSHMELIVVEGYKFSDYPKIVLLRDEQDLPLLDQTKEIVAIYSWFSYHHPTIPVVPMNDIETLINLLNKFLCEKHGGQYEKLCNCKG